MSLALVEAVQDQCECGGAKSIPPQSTTLQPLLDLVTVTVLRSQKGFYGEHQSISSHVKYHIGQLERHGTMMEHFVFSLATLQLCLSMWPAAVRSCPRKWTLFYLSLYSHDLVSLRRISAPGFFLFVSFLAVPLPPLWHRHSIFTYRLGGTEEAFPCVALTLFPAGIWEQV